MCLFTHRNMHVCIHFFEHGNVPVPVDRSGRPGSQPAAAWPTTGSLHLVGIAFPVLRDCYPVFQILSPRTPSPPSFPLFPFSPVSPSLFLPPSLRQRMKRHCIFCLARLTMTNNLSFRWKLPGRFLRFQVLGSKTRRAPHKNCLIWGLAGPNIKKFGEGALLVVISET